MIFDSFIGEMPILENHLLPANASSKARNAVYFSGAIAGFPGNVLVNGTSVKPRHNGIMQSTSSIYHYDNGDDDFLLQFEQHGVSVVNNPLANDSFKRIYWTDGGKPKFTAKDRATGGTQSWPQDFQTLGIPRPAGYPSYTYIDMAPDSGGLELTSLVYTFVTEYGEESMPSDPTPPFEAYDLTTVAVTPPSIPESYNGSVITHYRVYMLSGGFYLFLAEREIAEPLTEFDDGTEVGYPLDQRSLGESISTVDFDYPPENLHGLVSLPGGYLGAAFENVICFSEPFLPYAWPKKYYLPLQFDIVGMVKTSQGVLVGTTGKPYLLSGTVPFAMNAVEVDTVLPCVSALSMVDMGEYAVYASTEGLVVLQAGSASLATKSVFSVAQWREMSPETMQAVRYLDFYLVTTVTGKTFLFDPTSQTVTFLDLPFEVKAFSASPKFGVLILATTGEVIRFGDDYINNKEFVWKSRRFVTESNDVFAWAKVEHFGDATFKFCFYDSNGEEVMCHEVAPVSNRPFRLPPKKTPFVGFEVQGTNRVSRISIGLSIGDLHNG